MQTNCQNYLEEKQLCLLNKSNTTEETHATCHMVASTYIAPHSWACTYVLAIVVLDIQTFTAVENSNKKNKRKHIATTTTLE